MAVTGIQTLGNPIALNPENVLGKPLDNNGDPRGIAPHGALYVPASGQIWIAENSLDAFLKYNREGVYQSRSGLYTSGGSQSAAYNTQPRGAALGGPSNRYILCIDNNRRVYVYEAADGSHHDDISLVSISETQTIYEGIAFRNGKIYVLDRGLRRVLELTPNAQYSSRANGVNPAYHSLKQASTDPTDTSPTASHNNSDPRGLAWISTAEEFWVLNAATKEVFRYDSSWNYVGKYSLNSAITMPRGLIEVLTAEGEANHLWILDNGTDDIHRHTLLTETVTPPAQVTGVTVTAVSPTSLRVSWTALTGPITDYEVQIDTEEWVSAGADDTEFVIGNLSSSTSYSVKVRGVNSGGNGAASAAVSGTTQAPPPMPPGQVTGVVVTAVSKNALRVSWTALTGTITDYEVQVDDGEWVSAGADDTEFIIGSLEPATSYAIKVRGVNADGNGTASTAVSGTTQALMPPGQVTGVTVVALSSTELRVSWTALTGTVTDYEVSVDDGEWMSAGADDTEILLTGLTPSTAYAVKVRGVNSDGNGTASAAVSGTTQAPPVMPMPPGQVTGVAVTAVSHTSLRVSWTALTETVTDYEVSVDDGEWISAGADDTEFVIGNLSPSTAYSVEVRARNADGAGPASTAVSGQTQARPLMPPGQVTGVVVAAVSHTSLRVSWMALTGTVTDYEVQVDTEEWVSAGADDTEFIIDDLEPSTAYSVKVRGVNGDGNGTASAAVSGTTLDPPMPPGQVTGVAVAAVSPTSLRVTWTALTGTVTDYEVQVDDGEWISAGADDTEYVIGHLSPSTAYSVKVRGVNDVGPGTTSAAATGTTQDLPPMPPSVVRGLQVTFPTATSALLKWTPTEDAETYEVSSGSGYIPTRSARTRYLLRNLTRGTQYQFAVRGRNDVGAGAAAQVSGRTPIASLHNALFFKECVNAFDDGARVSELGNTSNIIRTVADNDYRTSSAETDYNINIEVGGNPTRVDAIFVKGRGILFHSATPTGGSGFGYSNRRMPSTVKNWEGTDISTVVNGFQHDLYLLDQPFTGRRVQLRFRGTNVQITEIMLLEFLLEIDANGDFTEINPDYVDRSAVIHTSPEGGVRRSLPLGAERPKWETSYVVKIVPGKTALASVDEFVYQMGENPNVVHAQEPSRYPARIHPASFLLTRVPTRLRGDNKLLGDVVQFRVGEQ